MPETAEQSVAALPGSRRCQRRRSDRRASLQRAAAALAGAAIRPAFEDRSRAHDRPFGAIDLGDHEPAAGRRPAAARGAVARPRRSADGAGFARSRGRLFARAEDRPAQLRSRADRLLRRHPAARARDVRLSHARPGAGFRQARAAAGDVASRRRAARRIAGLGVASPFQLWNWSAEIGAPAGRDGRLARLLDRRERSAASAPIR